MGFANHRLGWGAIAAAMFASMPARELAVADMPSQPGPSGSRNLRRYSKWLPHGGKQERAQHLRQIDRGQLRIENGLSP